MQFLGVQILRRIAKHGHEHDQGDIEHNPSNPAQGDVAIEHDQTRIKERMGGKRKIMDCSYVASSRSLPTA